MKLLFGDDMDILIDADEEILDDAERALQIAEEIAGPLAMALPFAISLMAIVHRHTHGPAAMDDWTDRLKRFTAVFPVVDEDTSEKDRDWLVAAGFEIHKAWAAAEPRIKTRALQMLTWSAALAGLHEAYGDDAVEAFVQMQKDWAAVWDSSATKN
jgi:hypothetical protein